MVDPTVGACGRAALGERHRFGLVRAGGELAAFADVGFVDRVQGREVGQVAELVVVRVLHGVRGDAVLTAHRADRDPLPGRLPRVGAGLGRGPARPPLRVVDHPAVTGRIGARADLGGLFGDYDI
nr:hypothetical protein [Dactylosporangium aurantiacum]